MPRLIVFAVGVLCLSCSSQAPVEPKAEKAALGEQVAINGDLYQRVMAKPTSNQANDVIVISIPVSTSGGNITIADEITIAGKTYTANCGSSSESTADDVGNTRATATDLTSMPPTSSENWTFFRSQPYQLTPGDVDYFRVRLTERAHLGILSDSPDRSNSIDTYGTLMNRSGQILAQNDDSKQDPPHFVLVLADAPAGTYYVEVKGATSAVAGTYELWTATQIARAGKPVAQEDERQIQIERMARF